MSVRLLIGDCRERLRELDAGSVNTCVTSPPYFGLRDYGHDGQIGLEDTPDAFVAQMVEVFREVRRVLRDDGTCWINLGDSYASNNQAGRTSGDGTRLDARGVPFGASKKANDPSQRRLNVPPGLKAKDLIGIPWRVAFALQADGWYLRQDIIWAKPNPMPESVRDRCTKAHEYVFLLSKGPRYHYDHDAIREEPTGRTNEMRFSKSADLNGKAHAESYQLDGSVGANRRSVWTVATQPFKEAHFATYPPELIEPCILAGCPQGGAVLDPFGGAGTTGLVADRLQRNAILIELNPTYAEIARKRLEGDAGMFSNVEAA